MNKNFSRFLLFTSLLIVAVIISSCGPAASTNTPTPDWRSPTFIYFVPTSNESEYTHYSPSDGFNFRLEFDYPSSWLLTEYSDEIGLLSVSLHDPRFLTLPTPMDSHPTSHDFGSVYIWIMSSKPDQTPDSELKLHKESYINIHWMTVLNDYEIRLDGYDASVLEYRVEPFDNGYTSLMFNKRIYFMPDKQVYEIIFTVADQERSGEFEKGFEYFINSIQILP